ncbi:MAG TPA: PEGA domain-containing protein [Planctomycetaceae bacterium]|nr:PEGA domain-containing protein [Planctomycetaceae bacterium]HIQ20088.1 PEGA domain-containing protein [Planctomycetota bacterium]
MTIRTTPPGALVYVDDYEIGTTPVSANFTYYGPRKIRLVKDGYETRTILQPVPPPWYQVPPLDFITENLVPGEIRDHRVFTYPLTPRVLVPTEQIISRGEALRREVQGTAAAVPPPARTAPPQVPSAAPSPVGQPPPAGPQPPGSPSPGSVPLHSLPPR